jgi:hypothetical protein
MSRGQIAGRVAALDSGTVGLLSPLGIFDELSTSSVPSSGTPFHGLCCPASGEPDPTAVANRAIAQEPPPARRQVHAVELAALRASPLWLVPDELVPRRTRPRQKPAVGAQQAGGKHSRQHSQYS